MSTRQKLENKPYIPKEWETVNCPVCNSKHAKPYEKFGNTNQYLYVLCQSCELVYLSPRPKYDDDFVHDAYEFYAEGDDRFQTQSNEVIYVDQKNPEAELLEIKKFDKKASAILDVGCAMGTFVNVARKHYAKTFGLEVSKRMAEFVEKRLEIKVFADKFENLQTDQKFSCIYMSHVIEHIPDPHLWLQKAKTMLDKDGILVICVPNMFSLARRIKLFFKNLGLRKGNWEAWRTPDHLYEPTIPAFRKLFEMNGYEILHFSTYTRSEIVPTSFFGKIFHTQLHQGSNLRFYVKPK